MKSCCVPWDLNLYLLWKMSWLLEIARYIYVWTDPWISLLIYIHVKFDGIYRDENFEHGPSTHMNPNTKLDCLSWSLVYTNTNLIWHDSPTRKLNGNNVIGLSEPDTEMDNHLLSPVNLHIIPKKTTERSSPMP